MPRYAATVDVERAADMYAQGRTLREIGAELGLTATTVSQQLKSAGVTIRRGGHRSQGCRLPERR
jgi:DNA-binding transcriptional regulator LsrR (DeoR family)